MKTKRTGAVHFGKLFFTAVGLAAVSMATVLVAPRTVQAYAPSAQSQAQGIDAADAYEPDNVCAEAKVLTVGEAAQAHNLFRNPGADNDWVQIAVEAGQKYELTAKADAVNGVDADLDIVLYLQCDDIEFTRSGSGRLSFAAQNAGTFYVLIKNKALEYGAKTDYLLQVARKATPPKTIPLADVPVEMHRRAADFVDQMRGGPLAPNWVDATFVDPVRIIYRPDLEDEPAYYEFALEKPGGEAAGFVQLAAGGHDFPITHWNPEGVSPSQTLDESIAALDGESTQYFKLDALSYVAEYDEPAALGVTTVSTDVVTIGTLPTKLEGDLSTLNPQFEGELSTFLWDPQIANDDEVDPNEPASLPIIDGPDDPSPLSETAWSDWDALKDGYAANYGVLLNDLADQASTNWQTEVNVATFGEGLKVGDVRTVHALEGQTVSAITVSGPGADPKYLTQESLAAGALPAGVRLTVVSGPVELDTFIPFSVTIQYASGTPEVRPFAIVPAASNLLYMPQIQVPVDGSAQAEQPSPALVESAGAAQTSLVHGDWGPWSYWWAGTTTDQRLYDQIPANTGPNNFPCWSGCGATAWGVLFGWADYRASVPGSGWNHRWGIYRANGGYGADAVAPKTQDAGINNILMEIRGYIKTWCQDGGGWTKGTDMLEAWRYLNGRTGASVAGINSSGWWTTESDVRNWAINVIKSGRPSIIGREGHFPIAWGYAQQTRQVKACFICWWTVTEYNRWFWVNQGWGGSGDGWIPANNTWFAGTINAN